MGSRGKRQWLHVEGRGWNRVGPETGRSGEGSGTDWNKSVCYTDEIRVETRSKPPSPTPSQSNPFAPLIVTPERAVFFFFFLPNGFSAKRRMVRGGVVEWVVAGVGLFAFPQCKHGAFPHRWLDTLFGFFFLCVCVSSNGETTLRDGRHCT